MRHPVTLYRLSKTPPTVNALYAFNGKRGQQDRYVTARYRDWTEAAMNEIVPVKPIGPGEYELHIHIGQSARGDLDGYAKAIIDLLVKVGATPDDSLLCKLVMTKGAEKGVIVEVLQ